jgi:hypothetical protein
MAPLFIIEYCQILKEIMAVYYSIIQAEEDTTAEFTSYTSPALAVAAPMISTMS